MVISSDGYVSPQPSRRVELFYSQIFSASLCEVVEFFSVFLGEDF